MMGTNDVRLHGENPTKILVSHNETEENLNMINNFAEEQTNANRAGMTPTFVIEDRIAEDPFFAPQQLMWRNDDLEVVVEIVPIWTARWWTCRTCCGSAWPPSSSSQTAYTRVSKGSR